MSGASRQTGRLFDPSLPRQSLEQFGGVTYVYGTINPIKSSRNPDTPCSSSLLQYQGLALTSLLIPSVDILLC